MYIGQCISNAKVASPLTATCSLASTRGTHSFAPATWRSGLDRWLMKQIESWTSVSRRLAVLSEPQLSHGRGTRKRCTTSCNICLASGRRPSLEWLVMRLWKTWFVGLYHIGWAYEIYEPYQLSSNPSFVTFCYNLWYQPGLLPKMSWSFPPAGCHCWGCCFLPRSMAVSIAWAAQPCVPPRPSLGDGGDNFSYTEVTGRWSQAMGIPTIMRDLRSLIFGHCSLCQRNDTQQLSRGTQWEPYQVLQSSLAPYSWKLPRWALGGGYLS